MTGPRREMNQSLPQQRGGERPIVRLQCRITMPWGPRVQSIFMNSGTIDRMSLRVSPFIAIERFLEHLIAAVSGRGCRRLTRAERDARC
jgi:hypothetical protein